MSNVERIERVCLCGSTRFSEVFQQASLRETLKGRIVLSIGTNMRADMEAFKGYSTEDAALIKHYLDVVHFHKIMASDRILVLNVGGYIGESTTREILFALSLDKVIDWWDPENIPQPFGMVESSGVEFADFIDELAMLRHLKVHVKSA